MTTFPQPWFQTPYAGQIDVRCQITTPGGFIDLNDHERYELEKTTFSTVQATFRRSQATNPYVSGSFTVNAVPENVMENLSVWCRGDTHADLWDAVIALTDALRQVTYNIERIIEDDYELWSCFTADYSVNYQQEYLHARTALVNAQIPRLPETVRRLA